MYCMVCKNNLTTMVWDNGEEVFYTCEQCVFGSRYPLFTPIPTPQEDERKWRVRVTARSLMTTAVVIHYLAQAVIPLEKTFAIYKDYSLAVAGDKFVQLEMQNVPPGYSFWYRTFVLEVSPLQLPTIAADDVLKHYQSEHSSLTLETMMKMQVTLFAIPNKRREVNVVIGVLSETVPNSPRDAFKWAQKFMLA